MGTAQTRVHETASVTNAATCAALHVWARVRHFCHWLVYVRSKREEMKGTRGGKEADDRQSRGSRSGMERVFIVNSRLRESRSRYSGRQGRGTKSGPVHWALIGGAESRLERRPTSQKTEASTATQVLHTPCRVCTAPSLCLDRVAAPLTSSVFLEIWRSNGGV